MNFCFVLFKFLEQQRVGEPDSKLHRRFIFEASCNYPSNAPIRLIFPIMMLLNCAVYGRNPPNFEYKLLVKSQGGGHYVLAIRSGGRLHMIVV